MTLDGLLALVPPYHATQPQFMAMLRATFAPFTAADALARTLPSHFDLDTAIGAQLDVVGEWVGRERVVRIPLAGIYFTWDDPIRGWDQGVWKGVFDTPVGITSLDDEVYRRLLRANIAAKRWDGTVPGAQAAFDIFFIDPATHVFVQDNAQVPFPKTFFAWDSEGQGWDQGEWFSDGDLVASAGTVDVSMTIGVSGRTPPPVTLALLGQAAIPIKPAGVQVDYAVTSVDGAALFGFDVQNEFVAGWDVGAWGVTPNVLLTGQA